MVAPAAALVCRGEAVQVDPIKPTLKAPEIKLLKLSYDKLLTNFAFKFNLRRYTEAEPNGRWARGRRRVWGRRGWRGGWGVFVSQGHVELRSTAARAAGRRGRCAAAEAPR